MHIEAYESRYALPPLCILDVMEAEIDILVVAASVNSAVHSAFNRHVPWQGR
jgi:hypothetical protein